MARKQSNSGELIETGINWDHGSGEIVVSTRRRGTAIKLQRLGLKPVSSTDPTGYTTFRFSDKLVTLSFRVKKARKPLSAARRSANVAALKLARETSKKNRVSGTSEGGVE